MRLGIFAKTFKRPGLEGVFAAAQAHGLDCVQFNMACAGLPSMPDEIHPSLPQRIRAAGQASGVAIVALSGTYNMIHPDPQVRAEGLRRLGVLAGACRGLGVSVITLCSGTRDLQDQWRRHPDNDSRAAWADLLNELEAALRIAEERQVTLAFEPEQGNVISSAARGRVLLDELRSPRLKVVIDDANLIDPDCDQQRVLEEAFDLLGEDIILAHAKDRAADGGFCAAGQGILDYPHYLRLLQASALNGPLILHGLAENEVDASLRNLRTMLG
jgi:sugar phosphate isomerase/epimerase